MPPRRADAIHVASVPYTLKRYKNLYGICPGTTITCCSAKIYTNSNYCNAPLMPAEIFCRAAQMNPNMLSPTKSSKMCKICWKMWYFSLLQYSQLLFWSFFTDYNIIFNKINIFCGFTLAKIQCYSTLTNPILNLILDF